MHTRSWVRKASWLYLVLLTSPAWAQAGDEGKAPDKVAAGAEEQAALRPVAVPTQSVAAEPAPVAPASAPPQRARVGDAPLETGPTAMKGRWNPSFYGFLDVDLVHDSTQSFSSGSPGYLLIARPGSYAAEHGRTVFDARGSRFGFKLAAPEMNNMRATGVVEVDFFGTQLPVNYGTSPSGIPEGSFYGNALMRIRHAAIKVESPYVDVLVGQYWQLFGWTPMYLPVSVQVPGYPGVPYGRNVQFRLSHTFKTDPVSVELAIAAVRPPSRNGEYPDAHGAARLMLNRWRGVSSVGATGATFMEMPAGIGVSGIFRRLKLPEFAAAPTTENSISGGGVSVDLFLPVIRSDMSHRGNALNVTGNFTVGKAIGDMYAPGTIGGAGFPALPNPNGATPAPTWPQDIDNGLVTYDVSGELHAIKWETGMAGIQYYLPPSGRVWVAANYGFAKSTNVASFSLAPERIVTKYTLWDGVVYVNIVGPVTVAAEFSREEQTYGDGKLAKNDRVMMSWYYSFW